MYRRYSLLVIAGFLSLGLATARANTTVTIEFNSAQHSYGGAGTALYYGTLNGVSASFICDDATHDIGVGSTWNANSWDLDYVVTANDVVTQGNGAFAGSPYETATGDAENVVAGGPSAMTIKQSYSAVAYLADLLLNSQDQIYANEIQYAIWEIMDDPQQEGFQAPGSSAFMSGLQVTDTGYWAYQGYLNRTYTNSHIVFYSPDGNKITSGPFTGYTPQEFIGLTTAAEPSAVLLLALVLVAGVALSSTGTRWRKTPSLR